MLELNSVPVNFAHAYTSEPNKHIKTRDEQFGEAQAHNARGIAYSEDGKQDIAIATFSKAIELKPDFADAYNSRGVAYSKQGNYDRAIVDFTQAIKLKPDYAEVYSNRGAAYSDKGDYDPAIQDFNTAIGLNPAYANAYYNCGVAYGKQGNYGRAIVDFTQAIKLKPDYADAYNNRGVVYGIKGDYDRAIEDFNKAIELNPDFVAAYINRSVAYRIKGEYDLAIENCSTAIDLKSDYAEVYNNRGNAYSDKGDYDRAIADFNTAIELNPDYAVAYYNRGNVYNNKGDYDRAIGDFTQAIKLKPDYADAYNNRGVIYGIKGDNERAIEDFNTAIELNPNDANAYCNRGLVYCLKGKDGYERAIENYTTAIGLKPELAEAYYNRGELWLRLREWEKAKADLITAKNLGLDIVAAFRNDYKNVSSFERANRVKLPEDIAVLVRKGFRNRYPKMEKVLAADGKSLESAEVLNLVETLRNAGPPLGEYIKESPYFGIKTAPTEVFVVDSATRDGFIAAHPSSAEILKPFLHGRAIKRWWVEPPDQWLIFAYRGIEIDAYPAIRNHLEKHREALSKRKGKGEWYELQAPLDAPERFARPKLVCPNLYNTQTVAVETDGVYCGNTCGIIPTEETWLCGLLNTRIVEWFYSQTSKQLGAGELQVRIGYIKQIPIPDINATQKDLVRKLVDYLIYLRQQPTTNSKDLAHANDFVMLKYFERIINGLFYEFYMPDLLQKANRDLFKHLMDEQLPEVDEIRGDKMPTFRAIFEHLIHRKHPVQVNLFFQDGLRPIRIIEDKW